MARVFEHDHILQLAKFASVPVINGLSDFNHPCQALTDVLTIREHYTQLKDLRVTFIGDGNNVAVSLMFACAKLGIHFTLSAPEGYQISPDIVTRAEAFADTTGSTIHVITDPRQAIKDAQVVYTDAWVSMGQEEEIKKRSQIFPPYQVNGDLLSGADPGAIVMHCLPAHRGEEITDPVADGPHSVIFQQAENRMHAQKAILVHLLVE
jgi:ornithine carbamoyltransferase